MRARTARMILEAVARDHDERSGNDRIHHLVGISVNQNQTRVRRGVQHLEPLAGETFCRIGQLQIAVVEASPFTPARIEKR